MNKNEKSLVSAILSGQNQFALSLCKNMLLSNTAEKDKEFCRQQIELLEQNKKFIVPLNIEKYVVVEREPKINLDRFYIAEREKYILNMLTSSLKVSAKLEEMGISYKNSLLLYGEPGTGKTMFARAVAKYLELPFIYINLSNIISSYLGNTGQNLCEVFKWMQDKKCVLCLDEIDALAMKRGKEHDVGEMSRITISLMQQLDEYEGDGIIIAATNMINSIDKAVKRRFRIQHEIKRYSREDILGLIHQYFGTINYNCVNAEHYAEKAFTHNRTNSNIVRDIVESLIVAILNDTKNCTLLSKA